MLNKISEHLQGIQKKLPTWFKMRRDQNTVGARFLNVMGLSIDDVKEILDYAYFQQYVGTADLEQVDIIYKASIPSTVTSDTVIEFKSEYFDMQRADSLEQFLTTMATDRLNHREIFYDNPYYIDYQRSMVYVRKPYDSDEENRAGYVTMRVLDKDGTILLQKKLKLNLHHVWNFFDEFGLLLDTPRLYGEKNVDYKKRILNVFRRPANSSEEGLYNGIARELGLIREVTWKDGAEDLVLRDARIKIDSIEVDGEPYPEFMATRDANGRTVLTGDFAYEGLTRTVSYIAGITMHELHDKEDYAFQNELFDIDGRGTAMLQYYVDIINSRVPIMWDNFVWGLGFWDVASPELSGYGLIPTFYDADISGWKRYRP